MGGGEVILRHKQTVEINLRKVVLKLAVKLSLSRKCQKGCYAKLTQNHGMCDNEHVHYGINTITLTFSLFFAI